MRSPIEVEWAVLLGSKGNPGNTEEEDSASEGNGSSSEPRVVRNESRGASQPSQPP